MAVAYLSGGGGQFSMEYSPESIKISNSLEVIAAPVWGQQIKAQEFGNVTGRKCSVSGVEVNKYRNGCGSIDGIIAGVEALMDLQGNGPSTVVFIYGGARFGPAVITQISIDKYLWNKGGGLSHAKVSFELMEIPEN